MSVHIRTLRVSLPFLKACSIALCAVAGLTSLNGCGGTHGPAVVPQSGTYVESLSFSGRDGALGLQVQPNGTVLGGFSINGDLETAQQPETASIPDGNYTLSGTVSHSTYTLAGTVGSQPVTVTAVLPSGTTPGTFVISYVVESTTETLSGAIPVAPSTSPYAGSFQGTYQYVGGGQVGGGALSLDIASTGLITSTKTDSQSNTTNFPVGFVAPNGEFLLANGGFTSVSNYTLTTVLAGTLNVDGTTMASEFNLTTGGATYQSYGRFGEFSGTSSLSGTYTGSLLSGSTPVAQVTLNIAANGYVTSTVTPTVGSAYSEVGYVDSANNIYFDFYSSSSSYGWGYDGPLTLSGNSLTGQIALQFEGNPYTYFNYSLTKSM